MRQKWGRPGFKIRKGLFVAAKAVGVVLAIGQSARATTLTWDAGGSSPLAPLDGGGIWDLLTMDWSNGTTDVAWPGTRTTTAAFGGAGGTAGVVTLASPITVGTLQFNKSSGDYTLAGSTINISTGNINTAPGTHPVIASNIVGSAMIFDAAGGSVTLSGSNNYTGGTGVAGALYTDSPAALGTGQVYVTGSLTVHSSCNAPGSVADLGVINVPAGTTFNTGSGLVNSRFDIVGTLNAQGTVNFSGSQFELGGGVINGTINLTGSSPSIYLSSPEAGTNAPAGSIVVANSGPSAMLSGGGIPPGVTLTFQPTGSSTFNLNTGGLNSPLAAGGIFTSISADQCTNTIFIGNGNETYGTFNIAAAGTPSSPTTIVGNLGLGNQPGLSPSTANFTTSANITDGATINGGAFLVSGGATVTGPGFNISSGSITINNGNLTLSNYFGWYGGTINGTVNLIGPSLSVEFTNPGGGNATFVLQSTNASAQIESQSIPAGVSIVVQPFVSSTVQGGSLINNGEISLIAPAGGVDTFRTQLLTNHSIFVTSAIGTPGGSVVIIGPVNNFGTFQVSSALLVSPGTGRFNQMGGTVTISPGASLVIQGPLAINGGKISLASTQSPMLQAASITFGAAGLIDLGAGVLDVQSSALAAVTNEIQLGFGSGRNWQGNTGITSSNAAADAAQLSAVGVMQNNQSGTALYGNGSGQMLFHGVAPGEGDILGALTYYGDTNLDGKVDGSDYSRIDNGFLQHLTGWFNGDFNYDGFIDGSDYSLMDDAFNSQTTVSANAVATAAVDGPSTPVPEPAFVSTLLPLALTRRRKSKW